MYVSTFILLVLDEHAHLTPIVCVRGEKCDTHVSYKRGAASLLLNILLV